MKTLLKTMPLLLVLCLAVFAFPNQALAAANSVVLTGAGAGGTDITINANDSHTFVPGSTISLSISGDTLTLTNINLTGPLKVTRNGGIKIVLVGSNSIDTTGYSNVAGITATNVTIEINGSGDLMITSDGHGIDAFAVETRGGNLSVNSMSGNGIEGDLSVNIGTQSVNVRGALNSVSGIFKVKGEWIESAPNPYSYGTVINEEQEQGQGQQQQPQQPADRENVVFQMNSSLSNPSSLTFTFDGGYFANFEGVWIHGYAVPTSAYTTRVIDGVLYIYLNEDYLFYVLGLARGEEHLMHAVFSNGYGITKFTY